MPPTREPAATRVRPWSPPVQAAAQPVEDPSSTRPPRRVATVLDGVSDACRRYGLTALRLSLALVFLWFGGLKLFGSSPVEHLIGETLPFMSPDITVPALGVVEVALGLAVAAGRAPRIVLLVLAGHLAGTFLTFVTAPGFMFDGGDPLLLTADGEFVLKNVVLISAVLVLIGRETEHRGPALQR